MTTNCRLGNIWRIHVQRNTISARVQLRIYWDNLSIKYQEIVKRVNKMFMTHSPMFGCRCWSVEEHSTGVKSSLLGTDLDGRPTSDPTSLVRWVYTCLLCRTDLDTMWLTIYWFYWVTVSRFIYRVWVHSELLITLQTLGNRFLGLVSDPSSTLPPFSFVTNWG